MEEPIETSSLEPGELYRISWIFYLLLTIAGLVWLGVAAGGPLPLTRLADPAGWWLDLGLGAVAGVSLALSWQVLQPRFAPLQRLEEAMAQLIGPLDGSEIFALALMSGCAEEIFFRGAMQLSWGPIWATLIFLLLHTGPGPVFRTWTVFAALAGGIFAALTYYRGNVLAAAVAHLLVNWINLRAMMARREPAPG